MNGHSVIDLLIYTRTEQRAGFPKNGIELGLGLFVQISVAAPSQSIK